MTSVKLFLQCFYIARLSASYLVEFESFSILLDIGYCPYVVVKISSPISEML